MNDYKHNWFYKMCAKQCAKDVGFVIVGLLLFVAGLLLFIAVISVLNILLSLVGVGLVAKGAVALFSKLPKLGKQMQQMSPQDFTNLGKLPPQTMYYSTFYFTDRYLCIPSAYALIRYDNIKEIHVNANVINGRESGIFVNIEFADGSPSIDADVKEWGKFRKETLDFMEMVEQHKNVLI